MAKFSKAKVGDGKSRSKAKGAPIVCAQAWAKRGTAAAKSILAKCRERYGYGGKSKGGGPTDARERAKARVQARRDAGQGPVEIPSREAIEKAAKPPATAPKPAPKQAPKAPASAPKPVSKSAVDAAKVRAKAPPGAPAAPKPKPAKKAPEEFKPNPGQRSPEFDLADGKAIRPRFKAPNDLRDPVERYIYKRLGKPMDADTARAIAGAPKGAEVEFKRMDTEYLITAKGKTEDGIEYTFERKVIMGPTGDMHISNESFKAKPPGGGFGMKSFAAQVETLSRLGVKSIETNAAGGPKSPFYNGYYTWPRFGYNAPLPKIAKQSVPDELEPVSTLHDLMRTPQGREWWKNNGEAVDVEFDLTPGSESRRILAAYEHNRNGMTPSKSATPPKTT